MVNNTDRKYKSERHRLLHFVVLLEKYLHEEASKITKTFNITAQQFIALQLIYSTHPISQSVIAIRDNMPDKMSDITRLLGRLEEEAYITKVKNKEDKRITEVSLTPKGLNLMKAMEEPYNAIYEFEGITDEEVETVNRIFKKVLS